MTIQLQPVLADFWLEEADTIVKTQIPYTNANEIEFLAAVESPVLEEVAENSAEIIWTFGQPDSLTAHKATLEKDCYEIPLNFEVANAVFKGSQAGFGPTSLTLQTGDFLVVTGQAETARTLFSRVLIGLVRPTQGNIFVNGQDLLKLSHSDLAHWRQSQVSFVTDNAPLWGMLSVLDNLLLPSYNQGNSALIQHEAEAIRLLKLCGLEAYRDCPASELTSKQAKLVIFLRSFVKQPQLLIYDNVSKDFSSEIEKLIWEILAHYHQNKMTIICTATSQQYKSWQTHNYLPSSYHQVTI